MAVARLTLRQRLLGVPAPGEVQERDHRARDGMASRVLDRHGTKHRPSNGAVGPANSYDAFGLRLSRLQGPRHRVVFDDANTPILVEGFYREVRREPPRQFVQPKSEHPTCFRVGMQDCPICGDAYDASRHSLQNSPRELPLLLQALRGRWRGRSADLSEDMLFHRFLQSMRDRVEIAKTIAHEVRHPGRRQARPPSLS